MAALTNFPFPTTLKQVQSFLGLAGYFRKFIKGYAQIAKPLSDILKKDSQFQVGEKQRRAVEELKKALTSASVLRLFNPKLETELHTDASQEGYGAILLQRAVDDQELHPELHPVQYMTRKTTDAERKYHSYELEILAVIEALKKFRVYLLGIYFKIITDCSAFQLTLKKKDLIPRVARWSMLMEEYDYEVEHRAGSRMRHADALSRAPCMLLQDALVERLEQAQDSDQHIKTVKKLLEHGEYEDYSQSHGLLYKGEKLVIPRGMQQ